MIQMLPYPPAQPLAPYIVSYFSGIMNATAKPDQAYTFIPNGCLELIIHLDDQYCRLPSSMGMVQTPDYMLMGLFSRPYQVHFGGSVPIFSIRFFPEAIPLLLGIPGCELLNQYEDVEGVSDKYFHDFCHRIKDLSSTEARVNFANQFFSHRVMYRIRQGSYVSTGSRMIRNEMNASLEDIYQHLNISKRQLERKFREQIGITPKRYQRLMRIRKVMHTLERHRSLSLTRVAYFCGYSDQAHFINDFKQITGQTPSVYLTSQQQYVYLSS